MPFEPSSRYKPKGDQAQAIARLTKPLEVGNRHETLLGVTGSGKTFTIANVIRDLDRPTLVISHNKTLAAQLYSEFKQFFPRNAVEYFVSYFDYYQPEAYIPRSDTYIEKDSSINEEIERLRLSTASALLSRHDTIVVASVSCIYGVTSPEDYERMLLTVKRGQQISREAVLGRLVDMLYERNDINFSRGKFRVRGDVVEVYPATADEEAIRIEFFGDEIDAINRFDPLTGHSHESHATIPQIGGMYEGDRSRKTVLVEYGFRLPSALDNRPLNFKEFMGMANQLVYVSATPAEFEIQNSVVGNTSYVPHKRARIGQNELVPFVLPGGKRPSHAGAQRPTPNAQRPSSNGEVQISRTDEAPEKFDVTTPGAPLVVEQIIRPTGLLDPKITLRGLKRQIDD